MHLGDYSTTRELKPGMWGGRALALNGTTNTSHLLHTLKLPPSTTSDPRHFSAAMAKLQSLDNPHVLRVQAYGWEVGDDPATNSTGQPWAVTDFTGDADGVVTLAALLELKGGMLSLEEGRRALEQLLDAPRYAHPLGFAHGTLTMDQIHIDRAGRLLVEFYGMQTALSRAPIDRQAIEREEVVSIVKLGYQLITGLQPLDPIIPVQEIIRDIDESWQAFFETGLGPIGFTSAAHAYSAAHGCRVAGDMFFGLGPVRQAVRTLMGR